MAETELSSPVVTSSPWSTRSISESSSDIQEDNDDVESTSIKECSTLPHLELPLSTIQLRQDPVPVQMVEPPAPTPTQLPVPAPTPPLKLKIKRPYSSKVRGKARANMPVAPSSPMPELHQHPTQLPLSMAILPPAKLDIDESLTEGFLSPSSPALSPTCSSIYGFEDTTMHYNPSPEPITCSPTINRFAPGPYLMSTPPRTHFSFFQPTDFAEFSSMDLTPTMHTLLPDSHDFDSHPAHPHHNDLPLQPLSLLCEYQLLLQKAN